MSSKTLVAAIQMVSRDVLADNLSRAQRLVQQAAEAGARLVVLPENFAMFGAPCQQQIGQAEATAEGPVRLFLADLARTHGVWLVAGSLPTSEADSGGRSPLPRVFTSCFVFSPEGRQAGRYDKMHLFDVDVGDAQGRYAESESFCPGRFPVLVDTDFARLGLSICYDLRFPELYRYLFQQGADILLVPAAFTQVTGQAHWLTLLRARAIENNCYVIAADQGGWHNEKRQTFGHSCIISPWGEILACQDSGEGVVLAEFDPAFLAARRRALPMHAHQVIKVPGPV